MVTNLSAPTLVLSPDKVKEIFPFHVAFGADWRIRQCGRSLSRVCPQVSPGNRFPDVFTPTRPETPFDYQTIWNSQKTLYLVREKHTGLLLRGQMLALEDQEQILFIASPWLTEASSLSAYGLSFEDFAIHDSVVDLLHVLQSQRMAVADLKKLTAKLQDQRASLRSANDKLLVQERESRKLALIAERTDNAVVLTEAEGRISWVNDGFTRLTGYTLEEARGRKPGSFLQGPNTDPSTVQYIRKQLSLGQGFSAELVNYSKSGREYWLAIEVQPIRDLNGQITNFMAVETDITARKDSEHRLAMQFQVTKALAETGDLKEVLPKILEAICRHLDGYSGVAWRADPNSHRLIRIEHWVSPSVSNLLASLNPPEELALDHTSVAASLVCDSKTPRWERVNPVAAPVMEPSPSPHSEVHHAMYVLPILVDASVWGVLEIRSQSAREPDASLLRILGILGEQIGMFVKRQDSERRLRETHAFQRAILASAQYSIIATTPEGIIQTFTKGAERMLGYSADELVGKSTPAVLHVPQEIDARRQKLSKLLGRPIEGFEAFVALARQGQHDEQEWTYVRKDGSQFPVTLSITALVDEHQRITGFLGIAADITERKKAIEQLRLAKEEAEGASRAKTEFLTTMSHEIRTPMNGVMGMTDLLLKTTLSTRQQELAEAVAYSADALLDVINDVLDFSKIEAGKLTLTEDNFQIRSLVDGVLEVASHRDPEKNLSLTALVDSRIPEYLVGDPIRLRQVLLNLVGNGVKFTDRGEVRTRVKLIHLTDTEVRIRLEVQDTGIGLDGDQIGKLFQPFVQADGSAARRFAGSGLGLAICRRLIELMHGEIGVQSQVGIGSTFWFELPTKRATWIEEPKAKPKLSKPVWIVSTDLSLFESLEEHFKGHGLTACRIPTAQALLQKLASLSDETSLPQIVLVDEPVWQSNQALVQGALQNRQSQFPSVLLARPATAVALATPSEASFSTVLTKPVKHSQLDRVLYKSSDPSDQKITPNTSTISKNSTPSGIQNARILLAEDNPINRRYCLLVLESLGARADCAINGVEVLSRVGKTDYDLILMDCNMPELDGYETTRAIRQLESVRTRPHRATIIALTANAITGERERCIHAGMDDYLSKPITSTQLKAAVQHHFQMADTSQSAATRMSGITSTDNVMHTNTVQLAACDIARLHQLCEELDADSVRELAEEFLRELPERLREIQTLSIAGPTPEFRRSAHSLKGSSASMGLDALSAYCGELEHAADIGDLSSIQRLVPGLDHIASNATSAMRAWMDSVPSA